MKDVLILIPAAGAASRMGARDKLLEDVGGEALLYRVARRALATGKDVVVTVPPTAEGRSALLEGLESERLSIVPVRDAAEGMAASLRRGAEKAVHHAGMMILPGDMPDIETPHLQDVARHFSTNQNRPARAVSSAGVPGHPVILPARMLCAVGKLSGDQGARALLAREEVTCVPLPDDVALTDLDTPEDWARWRARQGL